MPIRNPYICLAIVVSLATIALVSTAGIVVVESAGHASSPALVSLASMATGAIAGALAMSPHARGIRNGEITDSAHGQHQVPPRP